MNITVYLGANEGNDPSIAEAARELGAWIGESGNNLVYGGSKVGLMGILAESALDAGAQVTGVEPQFFIDQAVQLDTITRLIVTDTMAERKAKMIALADAFVALPGGPGTLDEISDVISLARLHLTDAPCVLFDMNGFYQPLKNVLEGMEKAGFAEPEDFEKVLISEDMKEIGAFLSGCQ